MAAAGILKEKEPWNFWRGLLVTKSTSSDPHVAAVKLAVRSDRHGCAPADMPPQGHRAPQGKDGEPELDLAMVRGRIRDYLDHKPGPRDMELAVEVSDSSYLYDRSRKLSRYARAGIAHFWIADLIRRVVELFAEPTGPAVTVTYGSSLVYGPDDEIAVILDGHEVARIPVRDLP